LWRIARLHCGKNEPLTDRQTGDSRALVKLARQIENLELGCRKIKQAECRHARCSEVTETDKDVHRFKPYSTFVRDQCRHRHESRKLFNLADCHAFADSYFTRVTLTEANTVFCSLPA